VPSAQQRAVTAIQYLTQIQLRCWNQHLISTRVRERC
jgi:hypothetical protein